MTTPETTSTFETLIGPVTVAVESETQTTLVSATITWGDQPYPIWFRIRGIHESLPFAADAFVPAALFAAMRSGGALRSAEPVSPRLIAGLDTISRYFRAGYPEVFGPVTIELTPRETSPVPGSGTALTFSGGVDSFYSLGRYRREINDLVFGIGFDVPLDETGYRDTVRAGLGAAASDVGLPLHEVETNIRALLDAAGHWMHHTHGSALASIGILLAPDRYKRYLISSAHTFAYPYLHGAHPMLDPLWSTEYVEFEHVGYEIRRAEKVVAISGSVHAQKHLRVCWESRDAYNCGVCDKCVRTMASLEAADALPLFTSFPSTFSLDRLRELRFIRPSELGLYTDIVELAESKGKTALASALRHCISESMSQLEGGPRATVANVNDIARLAALRPQRRALIRELWNRSTRDMLAEMPKALAQKTVGKLRRRK